MVGDPPPMGVVRRESRRAAREGQGARGVQLPGFGVPQIGVTGTYKDSCLMFPTVQ